MEFPREMMLNNIKPAEGSKKNRRRVGRGIGSGLGKTAGRGHKGQKSRAGGFHKVGFEGGQTALYRRLPKIGFNSLNPNATEEVRLSTIDKANIVEVNILTLKQLGIISAKAKNAKIINTGEINRAITVSGILITKAAALAVQSAGGVIDSLVDSSKS